MGVSFCHCLGDLGPYLFYSGEVFFCLVFYRLYFFHPHLSPSLRGTKILLYPLVGGGETSCSSHLG